MKKILEPLPKVERVIRRRRMPKAFRRYRRTWQFVGAGLYRHRHVYREAWAIDRERRGKTHFLYEYTTCIFDDCGQRKVRHVTRPYCRHCGSLKG